jgi:Peptidase dimerisation domain
VPRLDNPLTHLSAAVAKAATWQMPMRLNETTRAYFDKLAKISAPDKAARYRALLSPVPPASAAQYLTESEPQHNSMLRTSVVPTMLKAGVGVNVIPSEAEATFDVRALPDEDIPRFFEDLKRLIDDPVVRIVPITTNLRPVGTPSRLDTEMYRALEHVSAAMYPGATVLPTMSTGATDMAQLRAKGIASYGIGPASTESDTVNYGAHSDVERLLETSLYSLVEFTWRANYGGCDEEVTPTPSSAIIPAAPSPSRPRSGGERAPFACDLEPLCLGLFRRSRCVDANDAGRTAILGEADCIEAEIGCLLVALARVRDLLLRACRRQGAAWSLPAIAAPVLAFSARRHGPRNCPGAGIDSANKPSDWGPVPGTQASLMR